MTFDLYLMLTNFQCYSAPPKRLHKQPVYQNPCLIVFFLLVYCLIMFKDNKQTIVSLSYNVLEQKFPLIHVFVSYVM